MKLLLALIMAISLQANEAVYNGSHMGNYAGTLKSWFKVTYHTFGWVSNAYLQKNNNQDKAQWVVDKKAQLIQEAKTAAQTLALKREAKRFLIDNITFQVVQETTKTYVYLDCNLVISD